MQNVDIENLAALYEEGCFLEAYKQTSSLWTQPLLSKTLSAKEIVLAGRFAFRLGGGKYARWLYREALERFPDHDEVRYFTFHYISRHRNAYDYLRFVDESNFTFPNRPDLSAYMAAKIGHTWASFRDFDRSHSFFEKAIAYDKEDYWINALYSRALLMEDRLDESHDLACRSWEKAKGQPPAADCYDSVLCRMERFDEAASSLFEQAVLGESFEIILIAGFRILQLCRRDSNNIKKYLENLQELDKQLDAAMPLADRITERNAALFRINISVLSQNFSKARTYIQKANHPYFSTVLDYEKEHSDGERFILPHRPVQQNWQTCLPSSISTVLSHFDIDLDPEDLAKIATYNGTKVWMAEDWLLEKELCVTHVLYSEEIAVTLLKADIPFVYHETYTTNGHSVAAVGLDSRMGVILFHDPSQTGLRESIQPRVGDGDKPIGPFCTIITPLGVKIPELPESSLTLANSYFDFYRKVARNGISGAQDVLHALRESHADHPLVQYLFAIFQNETHKPSEAMEILRPLYEKYSDCNLIQRLLLQICSRLQNTAFSREILRSIALNKPLPEYNIVTSGGSVSPIVLCDYADNLRETHNTIPESLRIIRQSLRCSAYYGHTYHILSDIYLSAEEKEKRVLPARIAACLDDSDDHYAWSYFDSLRRIKREEEGLAYLAERAGRLGSHPEGGTAWNVYIDELENAGEIEAALTQMRASLDAFPKDGRRLQYACSLFTRVGHLAEAKKCLDVLNDLEQMIHYYPAAVHFFFESGNWNAALVAAKRWVEFAPENTQARQEYLRLLSHAEGCEVSLSTVREWLPPNEDDENYENFLIAQLEAMNEGEAVINLMRARVTRNPLDAEMWRRIGFSRLNDAIYANDEKKAALMQEGMEAKAQCEFLTPGWSVSIMNALLAECKGAYKEAITHYFSVLKDYPDYGLPYRNLSRLSENLSLDQQEVNFRKLLQNTLRAERDHEFEFIHVVAKRLGLVKALTMIDELNESLLELPTLIELRADILLQYARGTDREEVAESTPSVIEEFLTKAIQSYPAYRGLRLSLATALIRQNKESEAIGVLQEHLERFPMDMAAYRMLAEAMENAGDREQAVEVLQRGVGLFPRDANRYYDLSLLYLRSGQCPEAIKTMDEGLEKNPRAVWFREQCIQNFSHLGDFDRALAIAKEGVEIFPEGSYMWNLLGGIQQEADPSSGEAEVSYRKALSLNPRLFDAADGLAQILTARKKFSEAIETLKSFYEIPEHAASAEARTAWILRQQGEKENAYLLLEELLKKLPSHSWGWKQVMHWMQADEDHTRVKRLLWTVPDAMRYNDSFRALRIELLELADVAKDKIEGEWEVLLFDFPDSVQLYLTRFDLLLADPEQAKEARAVLEHIQERFPANLFILARWVRLHIADGEREKALENARFIWGNAEEENNWPCSSTWEALCGSKWEKDALRLAALMIHDRVRLHPLIINRLTADLCADKGSKFFRTVLVALGNTSRIKNFFVGMFPIFLEKLKEPPYFPVGLDAAMDALYRNEKVDIGLQFYNKNTELFLNYAPLAGTAASLLTNQGKWKEVNRLLANWKEMQNVEMWIVTNYIMSMIHLKSEEEKISIICEEVLCRLPHDHTAWYLVVVMLKRRLMTHEFDIFSAKYNEYGDYAKREHLEHEFFPNDRKYHSIFQSYQELLDAQDAEEAREPATRIRRLAGDSYDNDYKPSILEIFKERGWDYKKAKGSSAKGGASAGISWYAIAFVLYLLSKLIRHLF